MKKLLTLFLLLGALAAHSQSITEKELLGNWRLFKIDTGGIMGNLDTGEVTVTDPEMADSPDLEMTKQMINGPIAEKLKTMKLVVTPGFTVELGDGAKTETNTYTLTTENEKQLLTINRQKPVIFEVMLENGSLKLISISPAGRILYFTQIP